MGPYVDHPRKHGLLNRDRKTANASQRDGGTRGSKSEREGRRKSAFHYWYPEGCYSAFHPQRTLVTAVAIDSSVLHRYPPGRVFAAEHDERQLPEMRQSSNSRGRPAAMGR